MLAVESYGWAINGLQLIGQYGWLKFERLVRLSSSCEATLDLCKHGTIASLVFEPPIEVLPPERAPGWPRRRPKDAP